jgi:cytochrome c553
MKRIMLALAAVIAMAAGPVSIELPFDATPYPALGKGAPSADAINNNCLSCHSAEMVMTQPRLTAAEWAAEVAKMRNVYKAPIDPGDDAAITAWLAALSARPPKQAG